MMIQILKKNPQQRTDKDLNILVSIVREIESLRNDQIQTHHMVDLCSEFRYEMIPAGEFVFYQNDYGDKFYVILQGKVQVLVNNLEYIKKVKKNRMRQVKKSGGGGTKKILRPFLADDDVDKFSPINSSFDVTAPSNKDSKHQEVLNHSPISHN